MNRQRLLPSGLLVIGLVACVVGEASAVSLDIVNAGGFELPFTTVFGGTGQLEGQVNPAGEGQAVPPGQWQRTPGGTSTARVQSAVVAPGGGTQAVRIGRAADNDVRWAVDVDHLGHPASSLSKIVISWDMRVEESGAPGVVTSGPFFGVDAFDDRDGATGLLARFGVDSSDAQVVYAAPGTGLLTPLGGAVAFSAWNHFQITLDYLTDQFTLLLNDAPLGSFAFVDAGLDHFSFAGLAALGDSAFPALPGITYFDNFRVRTESVPEPGSAVLLTLALGVMAYVRSRRARA